MALGFGYFSASQKDAMLARDCPEFQDLLLAGPWQFCDFMFRGNRGVMAQWKHDGGRSMAEEDYGSPRESSNGLWYFPSKEKIRQEDIAKANCPPGIDLTTSRGVTITIPLASAAPRYVSFAKNELSDPAGAFGTLAFSIFERLTSKKDLANSDLLRLVLLALQQCYRVTADVLDDLRWITSADIDPILCCIMGSDPKALPDAGDLSPLPAPG